MRAYCWACVLTGVLAFGLACGQSSKAPKEIDYDELSKLLEQPGKVYFLDVRERYEIEKLGSVKGYVNIPMSQLPSRLGEIPKDKLIVTLWSQGGRAARAAAMLEEKGFKTLGSCGLEKVKGQSGGKLPEAKR